MNNNYTSNHQSKMKRKRKNFESEMYTSSSIDSDKSIFNSYEESLEELANLLNISESNERKDVTKKSPPKRMRSIRKSLQNNTIIINDSENESSDKDTADSSVCIIEYSPNTSKASLQPQSSLIEQKTRQLKNTLKPRTKIILLDDDSSSGSSQKSLETRNMDGENIAPSQAEDDVVELWSCMNNSFDKNEESGKKNDSQTRKDIFTIDTIPDLRNLDYIKIDTSPAHKRRKLLHNRRDLPTGKFNTHVRQRLTKKRHQMNIYNQSSTCINQDKSEERNSNKKYKLREIIIDGCNVAMAHTNGQSFSEKGIKLMVDYFESRGHVVKVFLPQHVRRKVYQFLEEMYTKGIVVFTPSRNIAGKQITPYDDRYILEYATKCEGIVISSDQYRDLYKENPEWRSTILNRLLTPTFVGDYIMFPVDPLGKSGPDLETFLRH